MGVTDKLLVVKENKCKCVFSNPNQHLLTKIKVDGCQITDGIRCDYDARPLSQRNILLN